MTKHITIFYNNIAMEALVLEGEVLASEEYFSEETNYKIAKGIYSDALSKFFDCLETDGFPLYVIINDYGRVVDFIYYKEDLPIGQHAFFIPHLYGFLDLEDLSFYTSSTQKDLDTEPKMRDNISEIGKKYDNEKPRTDLLPPRALMEVAKVLGFGAEKYGPENWRKVESLQERYTGAALRHIFDHMAGLELDDETGRDHIAHAICCLLFKLEDTLRNEENQEEGLRESFFGEHREGSLTYESGGTRKTYK